MSEGAKRLFRDYASLVAHLDSTFDGQVALPDDALDTDRWLLRFIVTPSGGIYKDCEVPFTMHLSTNYPKTAPEVIPECIIIHPNIDFEGDNSAIGSICLNVLDDWATYEDGYRSLELVIQGVLFLFYEPNIHDALSYNASFDTLSELQQEVDRTKCGLDSTDYGVFFSDVYKGEKTPVVCEEISLVKDDLNVDKDNNRRQEQVKSEEKECSGEAVEEMVEFEEKECSGEAVKEMVEFEEKECSGEAVEEMVEFEEKECSGEAVENELSHKLHDISLKDTLCIKEYHRQNTAERS